MVRLTGKVVDMSSHPVENATITIPDAGLFGLSDEKGNFTIENVPPGVQTVYVIQRHFQKLGSDINLSEDMFVTFELDHD